MTKSIQIEAPAPIVGWKKLTGDVFRAPPAPEMLSILCGMGV